VSGEPSHPGSIQKKPDPCSFVIFGVTGDLTHRLVIPSLYNLASADLLPERFCVVGVARKGTSSEDLRESLMKGLRQFATRPVDDAIAKRLLECVTAIEADPKDPASFDAMRERRQTVFLSGHASQCLCAN
jgi:glucose-6-phosphate 1-dehydrogenase